MLSGSLTGMTYVLLQYAVLAFEVFALVDAAIRRDDAFRAADKQRKSFWLLILGLAALCTLLFGWLGIFGIAGLIATIVYTVDVRPALRRVTGGGRGDNRRMGPYGPW
ncbi:DUF2516 family protein [Allostreptomyces psammosilenae]|uniref:Fatty acid desaturase n=1 Tax=Allostreptomyces psammosilenae TaxID=1892865 RepID=A0A852ZZK8_9ACTN|nr:DUF2516 family protein [Allostreptomyces psammosilenae]NYI07545.1 fatty acid desaturase [Allostreptomyces psammosilenae]